MTLLAKRMENPQNDYDNYIGADAIMRFIKTHKNIPNYENLEEDYRERFYNLYRILADSSYKTPYTPLQEKGVEAMAVFDFCKKLSITRTFTADDKDALISDAREVLLKCASDLIPRSNPQ